MEKTTLELETVTPLFIAGADQRNIENEGLRAPSLRGLLRWWFRALKATDNLQELKKEESGVFGSTNCKSAVNLMIKVNEISRIRSLVYKGKLKKYAFKYCCGEEEILDATFDSGLRRIEGKDAGICYFFSILHRPFLDMNSSFTIKLSSFSREALRKAVACLWCAVYLGNFGARARRGAGSLTVLSQGTTSDKIRSLTGLDFILNKDNSKDILDWIMKNLEKAVEIINNGEKPRNFSTGYTNLCFSRMIVSKNAFDSWKDALNDIGRVYEKYRFEQRRKKEYLAVAAFGFPIVHGKKFTVYGKLGKEKIKRRTSPLIFKIYKSNGRYYWGLIRLSGEFLPEGGIITTGKRTQKPDYKTIDDFWNIARKQGYEKVLLTPLVLDEIVNRIKKEVNPRKIILFGSRARGDAHKNADIDLAVDSEKPVMRMDLPADIIWLKNASEDVKERINREGVVIYERNS